MTRTTSRPELDSDFARRIWPVLDVQARIAKAAAAERRAARSGAAVRLSA
jgi:hypothetical protein